MSVAGDPCACRMGSVCPARLVCCPGCWERILAVEARLEELGVLRAVRDAAGGPLSFAFALSRSRGTDPRLARGRLIRAAWDRLRPLGWSRAQLVALLGVDLLTFERALRES
jgi:hypothetical protein